MDLVNGNMEAVFKIVFDGECICDKLQDDAVVIDSDNHRKQSTLATKWQDGFCELW